MKVTMAFSVVKNVRQPDAVLTAEENLFTIEMALLVILETGWDVREDEQLNLSCFKMSVGHVMVTKLANSTDQVEKIEMFGGHKTVTELTNLSDQVEKSLEFDELCDTVQAMNPSVMYNEMGFTVFNRERRAVYNIYETAYSQQIHTCTNAMEQCRNVDKQVGITMTHLAYCWDGDKQMQIVSYEVRDQVVFNKAA